MVRRVVFSTSLALIVVVALCLCFSFGMVDGQWIKPIPGVLDTLEENKAEMFKYRMMRLAQAMVTPNQELFDVKYYGLNLDIDPNAQNIMGEVTVLAEVVDSAIDQMELNFLDNMTVSEVTMRGSPATFDHLDDMLAITLDRTYNSGEQFEIMVDYSGNPQQSGLGAFGFDTHNGKPMIWSLSEPFGARNWWPCKDVPSDKADSVDIKITVPKELIVASNGLLRDVIDSGSTKTYWWHEGYPITTYLVSVAIYEYMTYSDYYVYSPVDSMEVVFFVFPDHYDWVQDDYSKTVEMIETFSQLFGQYPFIDEKYGHAEFVWGGGMEHQTITSLGGCSELLIAHELAHQWWGDMITCDDFHHIWLNEGFATYSEALWLEQKYGKEAYHEELNSEQYFGGGTIYVHDLSEGNIFHYGRSYQKGAWVLHMLRHVVGDSTFFDILKAYYNSQHQYGTATTEEFRDICEAIAGMDLDWFFQQWIYEEYYPSYVYEWSWETGASYKVNVTIDQTQTNTVLFKMPIDVTIETVSGETTLVVWDSLKAQEFQLTVDEQPINLLLDKDNWILKRVQAKVVNPTFDRGILFVNGVHWGTYGSEIYSAYEDSAFWGHFPISFWDCFEEPGTGYPSDLPAPMGHGEVPSTILGQYSTVIWVGNNYMGDLASWFNTAILSYLEAGGNLILLSGMGRDFIDEPLREYLGINWAEGYYSTINNCVSTYEGLADMPMTGYQNYNAVFDTSLQTDESTLLFKETASFGVDRGLGVWGKPTGGGTYRENGGQFVFISGRPYRYSHSQMRSNVEYILTHFFNETGVAEEIASAAISNAPILCQNHPNPFNTETSIQYTVASRQYVSLKVYDMLGREVRTLVSEVKEPGVYHVYWDGRDRDGKRVGGGIYFCRLEAHTGLGTGDYMNTKKVILLK